MSRKDTNLPTSKKAAKAYIKTLMQHPDVKDVYIKGSRSPLTPKKPHKKSDWDIEVISDKKLTFASPRFWGWLHADLHVVKKPSIVSVHWKKVL